MYIFKKIYYNCHKATFLIEKKQLDSIRFNEQLELLVHLARCPACRLYQKQSTLINRRVQEYLANKLSTGEALDEAFKEELQQKINKQLGEK